MHILNRANGRRPSASIVKMLTKYIRQTSRVADVSAAAVVVARATTGSMNPHHHHQPKHCSSRGGRQEGRGNRRKNGNNRVWASATAVVVMAILGGQYLAGTAEMAATITTVLERYNTEVTEMRYKLLILLVAERATERVEFLNLRGTCHSVMCTEVFSSLPNTEIEICIYCSNEEFMSQPSAG